MRELFINYALRLLGPATDALLVRPSDNTDFSHAPFILPIETGGSVTVMPVSGASSMF